jgi:hypothetical protein
MSFQVTVEVCTLTGLGKVYEVDLDTLVADLIKTVVMTHPAFTDQRTFNIKTVDWSGTRLILSGKTLEHFRALETYAEFHNTTKMKSGHKLHIIPKGGSISMSTQFDEPSDSDETSSSQSQKEATSPIAIKSHFHSGTGSRSMIARSFPGTSSVSSSPTTSFLESQINRIDRRSKSDQMKLVTDSLNDLSTYLKTTPEIIDHGQKLDSILAVLLSIDQKLSLLMDPK